jgi:hypothetical protein
VPDIEQFTSGLMARSLAAINDWPLYNHSSSHNREWTPMDANRPGRGAGLGIEFCPDRLKAARLGRGSHSREFAFIRGGGPGMSKLRMQSWKAMGPV